VPDITSDVAHTEDESLWHKRFHASADPGRPTNVHLRVDGWPGQRFALLFVDWLRADAAVREEYLEMKRAVEVEGHATTGEYADAKEPWFADAYRRAWKWADETGWRP
jgi:dephospho-CoA kinase